MNGSIQDLCQWPLKGGTKMRVLIGGEDILLNRIQHHILDVQRIVKSSDNKASNDGRDDDVQSAAS